jgi:peptidoglycan/LPS O-acetylase OafA/YrhL
MAEAPTATFAVGSDLKYIPQLDGLRACAILGVFLFHSPLRLKGGWMGVDLFFVLSGFLITRILLGQRGTPVNQYFGYFYSRRARRILPAYLLALAAATILLGFGWMKEWPYYLGAMNFAHPGPDGLQILWSLAVEEQFYLVWPFVILLIDRKYLPYVAMVLILTAPILRGVCTPFIQNRADWSIYKLTPFRMDCLATGALIGILYRSHSARIARLGTLWLVPTCCALGTLFYLMHKGGYATNTFSVKANVITYELSLIACTGILLWALSGRFVGILTNAPMRWIGRLSYSLYLIHRTAFEFLESRTHNRLALSVGAASFCLIYSALSWRFIESPILRRKSSRSNVRAGDAPAEGLRS